MTRPLRRRPGSTLSLLALAGAAIGGLFAMGAVPAPSLLSDPDAGTTTGQQVSRPASAAAVGEIDPTLVAAVAAIEQRGSGTEDEPTLVYEGADGETIDPERLRVWLEDRNSPLAAHAEDLVAAGLAHGVDPRLVVGIAAIESSAGKRLPPGSHNAWGWSGNGPHGLHTWPSWPVAIDEFTEGLARVYDTDNVDERMARKYVPPNWEKWLRTVRWVINDI